MLLMPYFPSFLIFLLRLHHNNKIKTMIIIIVNRLAKSGKDEMRQNNCEGAHGLVTSFPITNSLVALHCINPWHCFFLCTIIEICSFFFRSMEVLLYCTFLLQTYLSGGVVCIDMEMRERKIDRSVQLSIRSRCDEL